MKVEIKSLQRGDYFGVEPLLEREHHGVAVHYTTAVAGSGAEVLFVPYQRMRSHLHGFHASKEVLSESIYLYTVTCALHPAM